MKPSFHSAAREFADNLASLLPAEAAAFTSAAQAYEQAFVERCAVADTRAMLSIRLILSNLKGFRARDFEKLVREEKARILRPVNGSAKMNGHAKEEPWESGLLRTEKGKLLSCYENLSLYMENHPEWRGVIGYNEFTGGHEITGKPPSPVSIKPGQEIEDHFDTEATRWFERQGMMAKPDVIRRVVDATARRSPFHPVRRYLEKLEWDGEPRTDSWLIRYCGVESSDDKPNTFAMAAGDKFLISAVARVMEPGCKADYMLLLEGKQRIGKSTVVKTIAGEEWFSNQLSDIGGKDASMQLRGVWIVEFDELDSFARADVTRLKSFISTQTERFRLPYGKRIVKFPRQCVFIGTTNAYNWNKDPSGASRFWPFKCHKIDISALERDRDQLLAEAVYKYRRHDEWWIKDEQILKVAKHEQKERYDPEVWRDKIQTHIPSIQAAALSTSYEQNSISVAEIMEKLGMESPRQDQTGANRVARCLIADGWEQYRETAEGRPWRYRRPADDTDED